MYKSLCSDTSSACVYFKTATLKSGDHDDAAQRYCTAEYRYVKLLSIDGAKHRETVFHYLWAHRKRCLGRWENSQAWENAQRHVLNTPHL